LQALTPAHVVPEPTQFINTSLNAELCRQHSTGQDGIDLGDWLPSMKLSIETGAPYSNAFSITPAQEANAIGQKYFGPVVLITDARVYSATDIFAAGFQDHRIGPVLGVDANTGAGGANVWTHSLLRQLVQGNEEISSPYRPLPAGVDMRVSIRRTLRVGSSAGTPVEDLGVRPDVRHWMTRRDVDGANNDLMAAAAALLVGQPVRRLDITGLDTGGELVITTTGVDRVDAYLNGRPVASLDVADGVPATVHVGAGLLRLVGFIGGELVANRQATVAAVTPRVPSPSTPSTSIPATPVSMPR
jgi:hypothetical protein